MSSTSRTREHARDDNRQARAERPKERSGVTRAARKGPPKQGDGDTDAFYDEVVQGGHAKAEDDEDDVYQKLRRVNVRDMQAAVVEDLDPANLAAALEDSLDEGPEGYPLAPSAIDEDALKQDTDAERTLRLDGEDEEDDGGSVSPEELGDQFLRGAVQQERRVARNDAESPADVDLLSDSLPQVSLFDHNHDPLGEPHFPEVIADETQADAAHRPVERSASKRAARYAAEDRSAALGANRRTASHETTSTNEPTSKRTSSQKSGRGAGDRRTGTSKPNVKAQSTKAARSGGESKTTGAAGKTTSKKSDTKKAATKGSSVNAQQTRAASKTAVGKPSNAESEPSDEAGSDNRRGRVAGKRKSATAISTTKTKAVSPTKGHTSLQKADTRKARTKKARTQKTKPASKARRGTR